MIIAHDHARARLGHPSPLRNVEHAGVDVGSHATLLCSGRKREDDRQNGTKESRDRPLQAGRSHRDPLGRKVLLLSLHPDHMHPPSMRRPRWSADEITFQAVAPSIVLCPCAFMRLHSSRTGILLARQADADVLRAAAGSLNRFEGDGSFLERFQGGQAAAGSPSGSDAEEHRCDGFRCFTIVAVDSHASCARSGCMRLLHCHRNADSTVECRSWHAYAQISHATQPYIQ